MASILKVDKLDPQSGTALEIGTSGDTVTVPSGATLDISSATLTPPATLPASSGVNLTALNASNLGSGTVPTARLGTGTASSSTVLYGDQTYKAEPGGGITEADQWHITAGFTGTSDITANWTRTSVNAVAPPLGTGMSESSGIFTFPSTGFWFVHFLIQHYAGSTSTAPWNRGVIMTCTNGTSYTNVAVSEQFLEGQGTTTYATTSASSLLDVTDVSNVKIKFRSEVEETATTTVGAAVPQTQVNFVRYGDT